MTSVSKSSAEGALFRQSLHEGVLHHVTYMEFLRKMLDSIHILRLRRTISLALSLILSRDLCVPHCLSSCRDLSLQSRLAISVARIVARSLSSRRTISLSLSLILSRDLSRLVARSLSGLVARSLCPALSRDLSLQSRRAISVSRIVSRIVSPTSD